MTNKYIYNPSVESGMEMTEQAKARALAEFNMAVQRLNCTPTEAVQWLCKMYDAPYLAESIMKANHVEDENLFVELVITIEDVWDNLKG